MEKSLRIGLIFDYVVSEYTELMIKGVQTACKENNIGLYIFSIGELHDIRGAFEYQNIAVTAFVSSNNLDGIIFISGTQMHYLSKAEISSYIKSFQPIPVVNISSPLPGIPSIFTECYNAYKALLDNLIDEQCCRKFGILGVKGNSTEAKYRRNAIKAILEERGIPSKDITFWKANFDYRTTFSELQFAYENQKEFNYDAILCMNDEMGYAALDFCASVGLRVPEDICIAGFDDLQRSRFCMPTLTSINQQIPEQGYKAVEILRDLINGKMVPKETVLDVKIVLRQSTCRHGYSKDILKNSYLTLDMDTDHVELGKYSGTEWYLKKDQFNQITRYYTEMQYDMTSEQLKFRINDDMRSFGITACAVVLYEKPIEMPTPFDYFNLPHKATVYSAFDDLTGFDSSKEKKIHKFNPKEKILPDNILEVNSEGFVVLALFHNTLQYGYMLLRRGYYDVMVYDLLVKMMSSIISSIYSFALVHNETTKFRAKYDKLDVIARTDELTGLSNRRGLYDLGQTTLKFAKAMNQTGMIIYCDMDGLKKINDTFGHEAGDRAILAESVILKGNFRSNDIVARIGGDEFAIICPGLNEEAFKRIREQIEEDCRLWSEGNNSQFKLSISMGCVTYPSERVGYQITPLLSEADSLLYLEKRQKKKQAQKAE